MWGACRQKGRRLVGSTANLFSFFKEDSLLLTARVLQNTNPYAVSHQSNGRGLHASGWQRRPQSTGEVTQPRNCDANQSKFMQRSSYHTDSMYIHHTAGGSGRDSAAVVLGLIHALEPVCPGIGYFRPIDSTTHGGHRTKLMQQVFKLRDSIQDMQGTTQDKAYEMLAHGQMDDLLETILKAYETYKARHDFVVVEGTALRDGRETTALNAKFAEMLGTPVLLVGDAGAVTDPRLHREVTEDGEWQTELLNTMLMSHSVFQAEGTDLLGALVHGAPPARTVDDAILRRKMTELGVPFAGAIPDDPILDAVQVHDVSKALEAELLYGHSEPSMATECSHFIIATMQLSDLLTYLPSHSSMTKGSCVITAANRADIILGMLLLHESHSVSNVAALVLTGGDRPAVEIDALIKARPQAGTLPILLAPTPSFETAAILSKLESHIMPSSYRKIERAQVLFGEYVDMDVINRALSKERKVKMNPKLFQHMLFERAKQSQQHIVLPEGVEPRVLLAAGEVTRKGLCSVTVLGDPETIQKVAKQHRVDLDNITIVNPATSPDLEKYADNFYNMRKHKGLTLEQARDLLVSDVNYFGTAMVAAGDAGGMVSGSITTTANTVRPALQIIKTNPDTPVVSSVFFMCLPDKVLVYGDCAINTDPNAQELASIAIASADTATAFGITPRVAMLSYATGDSNTGPLIQKVADATAIAKKLRPNLMIEGPFQYDAAVNMETAKTKLKGKHSDVAGQASVLIFPDLNTGNNTYKAVQQSTGAIAMGPVLQGLRKPVNDLSRGCTVADIVTTIAITSVQAAAVEGQRTQPGGGSNKAASAA